MAVSGIVQSVVASAIPVVARDPPPEGQRGAQIVFTLPAGLNTAGQLFQLSAQSGLGLSQVVTLCVDNSNNSQSLTVTHGAFNETIVIGAGAYEIFPTFSAQGSFNVLLTVASAPASNTSVPVIFLNYARAPNGFSNNPLSSGQATETVFGSDIVVTGTESLVLVAPPAGFNFVIDDIYFMLDNVQVTAAANWGIQAVLKDESSPVQWLAGFNIIRPASVAGFQNNPMSGPISRRFASGVVCQGNIILEVLSFTNLTTAVITVLFTASQIRAVA